MSITFTQIDRYGLYTVRRRASKTELIDACKLACSTLDIPRLIWDFTEADLGELSRDDLIEIARAAKTWASPERPRKTAYVAANHLFTVLCMYSTIAVWEEIPGEFSAFHTIAEAERWLESSSVEMS